MINSEIARLEFSKAAVAGWEFRDERHRNWPVVYILDDGRADSAGQTEQT